MDNEIVYDMPAKIAEYKEWLDRSGVYARQMSREELAALVEYVEQLQIQATEKVKDLIFTTGAGLFPVKKGDRVLLKNQPPGVLESLDNIQPQPPADQIFQVYEYVFPLQGNLVVYIYSLIPNQSGGIWDIRGFYVSPRQLKVVQPLADALGVKVEQISVSEGGAV